MMIMHEIQISKSLMMFSGEDDQVILEVEEDDGNFAPVVVDRETAKVLISKLQEAFGFQ